MKVLFVTNNINVPGNGICSSVNRTLKILKARDIDARILSGVSKNPDGPQPDFPLEPFHFPIFQPIIDANGFSYAKVQKRVIRQAVEWADVVHLTEPLFLQHEAIRQAHKAGKPIVATFHLYTQNILDEIPCASWKWSNDLLMKAWRERQFKHCSHIQCPTNAVKALLEKFSFKSKLPVISNGIEISAEPVVASAPQTNPYIIFNTGRYANVKSQIVLLEAMRFSRHSKEIQLFFAGNGVNQAKLEKAGRKLMAEGILLHKPVFAFLSHEELAELAHKAYLYVHCAKLEVEGLGCLEAIREGCVPVIGKGELIGTTDFAMDDKSIYPYGDAKALAEKIDWWIEHPEERVAAGQKYADYARKFDIQNSISSLIDMYREAIGK